MLQMLTVCGASLVVAYCIHACLDGSTTAENYQILFARADDEQTLNHGVVFLAQVKILCSDALSFIHFALAGIVCMTLTSSCKLQCRGSKQGKQPAVAVTACIIRDDPSSSGLSSPELTDDLQSGSIPTPTPAVTPPLPASANPVWNHCLSCQFAEGQMQTGQLQLALLNETDGTILAR